MAQMVECNHKTLSSNPSTAIKKLVLLTVLDEAVKINNFTKFQFLNTSL
jgi:hypothetical protein